MSKRKELERLLERVAELQNELKIEEDKSCLTSPVELAEEYKQDIKDIVAFARESKRIRDRIKTIGGDNMGELSLCDKCYSHLDWNEIIEHHCPLGVICSVYNGDCTLDFDWADLDMGRFAKWINN